MNFRKVFYLVNALVVTLAGQSCSDADADNTSPGASTATSQQTSQSNPTDAQAIISSWPANPQSTAQKLVQKYGQPAEATASMLIWYNTGPFKRTVVFRDEIPHNFPMPHTDYLQQVIDYRAPLGKFSSLAFYDGSVILERTKGEMSARCDKEEFNLLALNLANDVAAGSRSVSNARAFYAKTVQEVMNGQSPLYTRELLFQVQHGGTADPDMAFGD